MNLLALQSILAASRKTEAPSTPPLTRDDIRSMARLEPAPVIVSVDTMRRLCEPDNDAERLLMVKANAIGGAPIWSREALLRAMFERGEVTLPAADPPLTAALAAFDVPTPVKKNRAQDRAAGQRGKRTK